MNISKSSLKISNSSCIEVKDEVHNLRSSKIQEPTPKHRRGFCHSNLGPKVQKMDTVFSNRSRRKNSSVFDINKEEVLRKVRLRNANLGTKRLLLKASITSKFKIFQLKSAETIEQFKSDNKLRYSKHSLLIFPRTSKFRQFFFVIVNNSWFEIFFLLNIIAHSIVMAVSMEWYLSYFYILDYYFFFLYFFEVLSRSIAHGFYGCSESYLSNNWSRFNLVLLVFNFFMLLPDPLTYFSKLSIKPCASYNFKCQLNIYNNRISPNRNYFMFNNFRVIIMFRPLKIIAYIPSLKNLVEMIGKSLLKLFNFVTFLIFFYVLLGVLGSFIWSGLLSSRCRATQVPTHGDWKIKNNDNDICGGYHKCTQIGGFCGSITDMYDSEQFFFNPTLNLYKERNIDSLNNGVSNYDNVLYSMLTVFHISTLDGWYKVLKIYQNGYNYYSSFLYFLLIIIIINYFVYNFNISLMMESCRDIYHNQMKEVRMIEEMEHKQVLQLKDYLGIKVNINLFSASSIEITWKDARDIFTWKSDIQPYYLFHQKWNITFICYFLSIQPLYNLVVFLLKVSTIISLCFVSTNLNEESLAQIHKSCFIMLLIIIFLKAVKFVGFGYRGFMNHQKNIVDFLVYCVAFTEYVLFKKASTCSLYLIDFIYLKDIFRRFKMIRIIIKCIISSVKEMGNYIVFLCLLIYCFALAGRQLFKYKLTFDSQTSNFSLSGSPPVINFDTLPQSILAVFILFVGNNWSEVFFDCLKSETTQRMFVYVFFVVSMIILNIIMMNLLLAFLVFHYQKSKFKNYKELELSLILKELKAQRIKRSYSISFNEKIDVRSYFEIYTKDILDDSDANIGYGATNIKQHNSFQIFEEQTIDPAPIRRCINTDKILFSPIATRSIRDKDSRLHLSKKSESQMKSEIIERSIKSQKEIKEAITYNPKSDNLYDAKYFHSTSELNDMNYISSSIQNETNQNLMSCNLLSNLESNQFQILNRNTSSIKSSNDDNNTIVNFKQNGNMMIVNHSNNSSLLSKGEFVAADHSKSDSYLYNGQQKVINLEQSFIVHEEQNAFRNSRSYIFEAKVEMKKSKPAIFLNISDHKQSFKTMKSVNSTPVAHKLKSSNDCLFFDQVAYERNNKTTIDNANPPIEMDQSNNEEKNETFSRKSEVTEEEIKEVPIMKHPVKKQGNLRKSFLKKCSLYNPIRVEDLDESPIIKRLHNRLLATDMRRSINTTFFKSKIMNPPPPEKDKSFFQKVDGSRLFKIVIYFSIFTNIILFQINSPTLDPLSIKANIINYSDKFLTLLFFVEIIIKIKSRGLINKPGEDQKSEQTPAEPLSNRAKPLENNYCKKNPTGLTMQTSKTVIWNSFTNKPFLRNVFNVFDSIILSISIFHLIFTLIHDQKTEMLNTKALQDENYYKQTLDNLKGLKALRLLTIIIQDVNSLAVIGESILQSISAIVSMLIIGILIILIFALFTTSYFSGLLGVCMYKNRDITADYYNYITNPISKPIGFKEYSQIEYNDYLTGLTNTDLIPYLNKTQCESINGEWVRSTFNFDTLSNALIVLFETTTLQNWNEVMFSITVQNRGNTSIFFVAYVIICCIFIMNLSVCAIVDSFIQVNYSKDGFDELDESQTEWVQLLKLFLSQKPKTNFKLREPGLKQKAYKLLKSKGFKNTINFFILINCINYLAFYYRSSADYKLTQNTIFYFCCFIFWVESFLKLFVFQKAYFQNLYHLYHFVVVVFGSISIIINIYYYFTYRGVNVVAYSSRFQILLVLIRGLKVFMYGRIVELSLSIRENINYFIKILPHLWNIAFILILNIFMYAIVGNVMFPTLMKRVYINDFSNFDNLANSVMLLIRCLTGEDWQNIMHEVGSRGNGCFDYQSYDHILQHGNMNCGGFVAYPFFVSFIIMNMLIFLNFFIAVMVDSFLQSNHEVVLKKLDPNVIELFFTLWGEYDTKNTLSLTVQEMLMVFIEMEEVLKINLTSLIIRFKNFKGEIFVSHNSEILLDNSRALILLKMLDIQCNDQGEVHIIDAIKLIISLKQRRELEDIFDLQYEGSPKIMEYISKMTRRYSKRYNIEFSADLKISAFEYLAKKLIFKVFLLWKRKRSKALDSNQNI